MIDAPLDLAYSPCPNDTYIFAAWTKALLPDAPPVRVVLDDVEALNSAARRAEHALTKVSYGAIPYLLKDYRILRAGGALGRGCGPLVVARPGTAGSSPELASLPPNARIAIPGELTTAYLLLRLAMARPIEAVVMRFDAIVDAVAAGTVDAGLIIHESRFTYADAGLVRVADLGEWWEGETGCAIPLGAILARRDLSPERARAIDQTIRESLHFAMAHGDAVAPYVREHAFEMDEAVMRAHIALYVNEFSLDLGDEGLAAISRLFEFAYAQGLLPQDVRPEFV
jgi:1,4-dihydroxy-6-naphthoate synthase